MYSSSLSLILIYLCFGAALCCIGVVVHLIGEQGHEERKTFDVSRARLSTVEGLEGATYSVMNQTLSSLIAHRNACQSHLKQRLYFHSFSTMLLDAYMEQALHQLFLPLLTFRTALCQLDDHSHVTCCQDGLQTLQQLIKQLPELQTVRQTERGTDENPALHPVSSRGRYLLPVCTWPRLQLASERGSWRWDGGPGPPADP